MFGVWRIISVCLGIILLLSKTTQQYNQGNKEQTTKTRHVFGRPPDDTGQFFTERLISEIQSNIPKHLRIERLKVEQQGEVLKQYVERLRRIAGQQVELVFLVDSSGSVGKENFFNEIRFVKKLLADFTVAQNATRVAVITFSSKTRVERHVDHLTAPSPEKHKCSLLAEEIRNITYTGGGTYTLGALVEAQQVFNAGRPNATKAVFLITDGYSNGGDPLPAAKELRDSGVEVFTFGIQNGNVKELRDMASEPKNEHSYILDSFDEFGALARRALHKDLQPGEYIFSQEEKCNTLCNQGQNCCDEEAACVCGIHTGHYQCVCKPGFYGNGLHGNCKPCPKGTYKNSSIPGDDSTCIPCPDPNHISDPGSSSIDQCYCKKGFRQFGLYGCAALTCPTLEPPEHGYFVKGGCMNEFNSACGTRCEPGYQLIGSSVRLCQEDGQWSGEHPACKVKTCRKMTAPPGGHMRCSKNDFLFQTTCYFRCQKGFELVGSNKRTCLAIAVWNGIDTECREVKCQPLPELKDGDISPPECITTPSSFGTTCTMSCNFGYTLIGEYKKQCTTQGKWSGKKSNSRCVDTSPPTIVCPGDITVVADDNENTAEASWEVPVAFDNSGYVPSVTVVPAVVPPRRFQIGKTDIVYHAEDLNRNRAKCKFRITVKDIQPPTVDRCASPDPVLSRNHYADVIWDPPLFSDNSQGFVTVKSSHRPGRFPVGKTQVRYTAFDPSGNNNTCVLDILVQVHKCSIPEAPVNGNVNCSEDTNKISCDISCMDGYGFATNPPSMYYCKFEDGKWLPTQGVPFPDCAVMRMSNNVIQPTRIVYKADVCADRSLLNDLEYNLQNHIFTKISSVCQENVVCDVENIEGICEEEGFKNSINSFPRQRRMLPFLQADQSLVPLNSKVKFTFQILGSVNTSHDHAAQHKLMNSMYSIMKRLQNEAERGNLNMMMGDQPLQFQEIKFLPEKPRFVCEPGSVLRGNVCVNCPVGTFFNVVSEQCESCAVGTYQPKEGQLTCLVCPQKTSTVSNNSRSLGACKAQCLPGSFSSDGLEICETCAMGSYQSEYASVSCNHCPGNTTTWRRGSRKTTDCADRCPPGHVSKTGLQPCFPCPRGYFQPSHSRSSCLQCPNKASTNHTGSTNVTDCEGLEDQPSDSYNISKEVVINECFSEPCDNGAECQGLKVGYICLCKPGYTGTDCETEVDECQSSPCVNNGTCVDNLNSFTCHCKEGFTGPTCDINTDECSSLPCLHGSTCIDAVNEYHCMCTAGYTGTNCEVEIDECHDSPCKNGAVCNDLIGDYSCTCARGFTGEICDVEINECESGPCRNQGTCLDLVDGFKCHCGLGFSGHRCEININECDSNPCRNGGKCMDDINQYKCVCSPGYSGQHCETEISPFFQLSFDTSGMLDYVMLAGLVNMTELTIAFWMKTEDTQNYGAVMSYATPDVPNALTLMDYSGFVFYVNGEQRITDVTANDGLWHHIAVSWKSHNGLWKIYKDGALQDQGVNLARGTVVDAHGILVLGQEQDTFGGEFSSPESFIGNITQFHIWDTVLTTIDIQEYMVLCDKYYGNVRSWTEVLSGIHGNVRTLNSSFCLGCSSLATVENGLVEWSGTDVHDVATYSCNLGFELYGNERRKCQVYSEWDGDTPRCERVSCGYPGTIPNAYDSGGPYTYGSHVYYTCLHGYQMFGNTTIYCDAEGVWEGTLPECREVTCTIPKLKENVVMNSLNKIKPGEVARMFCNSGYKIEGPSSVLCREDGTWDKEFPHCVTITCDIPPSVDHAVLISNISLLDFKIDTTVRYKCETGYKLRGRSDVKCAKDGTWEDDSPVCEVITCHDPPGIEYGHISGEDYHYNSVVKYHCQPGYKLVGKSKIKCNKNGHWSTSPPVCDPVYCSVPSLDNGYIAVTGYSYNDTVTYTCRIGYQLEGSRQLRCLHDGTLNGDMPKCKPVQCDSPKEIKHGEIIGDDYTFGQHINYECHEGFTLNGIPDSICREDGQWSSSSPTCSRIKCKEPLDLPNGKILGSKMFYKDKVDYVCDKGFILSGRSTSQCQSDGSWSNPNVDCLPVECPQLDPIANGHIIASGLIYGSVSTYSCDEGYKLKGSGFRRCLQDGTWNGTAPSCQRIECPPPNKIDNGFVVYMNLYDKLTYTCISGYELHGEIHRYCTLNGIWSGQEPQCDRIVCPTPSAIPYGSHIGNDYTLNSVVTYACEKGYILEGSADRKCLQNKQWSGTLPTCTIVKCKELPHAVENGFVTGRNYTYGNSLTVHCKTGYELQGLSSKITCLESGKWDQDMSTCVPIQCPTPEVPSNGKIEGSSFDFQKTVLYSCDVGYEIDGDMERRCQANKTWSGTQPACVKISCPKLASIPNGYLITQGLKYGDTLEYKCNPGYELSWSTNRRCMSDRTWSNKEPECVAIHCSMPDDIPNGKAIYNDTSFMSVLSYQCTSGFEIVGHKHRSCLENGTWSHDKPHCEIKQCEEPQDILNGEYVVYGTTYGSTVSYECFSGFNLIGDAMLTCDQHGRWSPHPPTCEIVNCHTPPNIKHGFYTGSTISFGSAITYACMEGYELDGDAQHTCLANASWSGSPPVCSPVNCSHADVLPNGKMDGRVQYGSTMHYSCDYGYQLVGSRSRTCMANKTWDKLEPRCDPVECSVSTFLNGLVRGSAYSFGSVIEFQCDDDFELIGFSNSTCQANKTWSFPAPECKIIKCQIPRSIPDGAITIKRNTVGGHAVYECNEGYEIIGDSSRLCLRNKTWSGTVPKCELISCPAPTNIAKAAIIGDKFTFNSIVEYVCEAGFEIIGESTRKCLASKTWSGKLPSCTAKMCPQPTMVENGIVTVNVYTVGSVAAYVCNMGFELNGIESRQCMENKTWSHTTPMCDVIQCPEPKQIPYGIMTFEGSTYGSKVTYTCDQGYELDGKSTQQCQLNKTWAPKRPECRPIFCNEPDQIQNGRVHGNNYSFSAVIEYVCDTGYILLKISSYRICQANGEWNGTEPICDPVKCNTPPVIQNGSFIGDQFQFGDFAKYSCNKGFEFKSRTDLECGPSGTWIGVVPECRTIRCQLPDEIDNGDYNATGDSLPYGSILSFDCDMGFALVGNKTRKCLENKEWTGQSPLCKQIFCSPPQPVQHSNIIGSVYSMGKVVGYNCKPGYELEGPKIRQCLTDGSWSGQEPSCHPISCDEPTSVYNGELQVSNFTFGENVTYTCHEGFELDGPQVRTCLENKTWSDYSPYCRPVTCQEPTLISNGKIFGSNYTFNQLIEYKCSKGFRLVGSISRVCLANKTWSSPAPKCLPMNCTTPAKLDNGTIIGSNYTTGNVITYKCHHGFKLHGPSSSTCLENGTWSGQQPVCTLAMCQNPPTADNAVVVGTNFSFGATVEYICNPGYESTGPLTQQCQADGTWSGILPLCNIITCQHPGEIENGQILGKIFEYGQKIEFICDPGYRLSGNQFRECLAIKLWSGGNVSCEPVSCEEPPTVQFGYINGSDFTYRQSISYKCYDGYDLVGPSKLHCTKNANWDSEPPQCEPVLCPSPRVLENGKVFGNTYTYKSTIGYSCNAGYDLRGPDTRHCEAGGFWSGNAPFCDIVVCPIPKSIENGAVLAENYTYGSIIHYMCNIGFELIGPTERKCLVNGNWSYESPQCETIICLPPNDIEHGQIVGHGYGYAYNEIIEYICDYGYEIEGQYLRTCQENKTWTGRDPGCNLVSCPPPPDVENADIIGNGSTFGDTIEYLCYPGYNLVGSGYKHCQADRTWSSGDVFCFPASCPSPPPIQHGRWVASDGNNYGSVIQYACNRGYNLNGTHATRCQSNQTWTHPFPTCVRLSCGPPEYVENAAVEGSSYLLGDVIQYRCHPGYHMQGRGTKQCKNTGVWLPASLPFCKFVTCGTPPHVGNSLRVGDSFNYGDFVYYRCREGFELMGNNLLECGDHGYWIGAIPQCKTVSCGPPPVIRYASTVVSYFTYGSRVRYKCNHGYIIRGGEMGECMANRTWMFHDGTPGCVPVNCGKPPHIHNGHVQYTGTRFRHLANYTCNDGHVLEGQAVITCMRNSYWSNTAPGCRKVICKPPKQIAHGKVQGRDYSYRQRVVYTCEPGYGLIGESTLTCNQQGKWSSAAPYCGKASCGNIAAPDNGVKSQTGRHYLDRVEWTCNRGYQLVGNDTAMCLDTGQWSSPPPRCSADLCPAPSTPPYVKTLTGNFAVGDSIFLSCVTGYRATENMYITCRRDSTWTKPSGSCRKVSCGKPRTDDTVVYIMGNRYNYQDRVIFICKPGLVTTKTLLTCQENGKWDGRATCRAVCTTECRNGGRCIGNNKCSCPSGFKGRHCEQAICIIPCLNQGTCIAPYKCTCRPGFTGSRCQEAICRRRCANGGRCIQPEKCQCPHGWRPPYCEDRDWRFYSRNR